MLFPMQKEWEMAFAASGQEALKLLDNKVFDVIVSDLRMPEMDGFQLLTEVRERYPHVIRVAFSAQTDQEYTLRSLGPIHQYLSKPLNHNDMRNAIKRVCSLHDLLSNSRLRNLVSRLESLPSPTTLFHRLVKELESPEPSLKNISKIIAEDQGMTTKILQFVNSAFFGLPRRITRPEMAVNLIGINVITALALTIHIFRQINQGKLAGFSLDRLWQHSKGTSIIARSIISIETDDKNLADRASTSGLLHDIGRLILIDNLPKQYSEALALASSEEIPVFEAEREIFNSTHAEVGAYLLGLWGLDDLIVEAVAYHHWPGQCSAKNFSALTAVHVANLIEHSNTAENRDDIIAQIDMKYLSELGLENRLPEWQRVCCSINTEESDNER